jgi:hypothetical protein
MLIKPGLPSQRLPEGLRLLLALQVVVRCLVST